MEFKKDDENYIYEVISKNVKKYRKLKGWTQEKLAEEINYSLSFISGIESTYHQILLNYVKMIPCLIKLNTLTINVINVERKQSFLLKWLNFSKILMKLLAIKAYHHLNVLKMIATV